MASSNQSIGFHKQLKLQILNLPINKRPCFNSYSGVNHFWAKMAKFKIQKKMIWLRTWHKFIRSPPLLLQLSANQSTSNKICVRSRKIDQFKTWALQLVVRMIKRSQASTYKWIFSRPKIYTHKTKLSPHLNKFSSFHNSHSQLFVLKKQLRQRQLSMITRISPRKTKH